MHMTVGDHILPNAASRRNNDINNAQLSTFTVFSEAYPANTNNGTNVTAGELKQAILTSSLIR